MDGGSGQRIVGRRRHEAAHPGPPLDPRVLDAYRPELENVVDTLTAMQQNYERAETENAVRLRSTD